MRINPGHAFPKLLSKLGARFISTHHNLNSAEHRVTTTHFDIRLTCHAWLRSTARLSLTTTISLEPRLSSWHQGNNKNMH
jgi:hypothetical protein